MQADLPFSNGGPPLQAPTPGVRQTPFAMTDTSYSQPGTSDVSAGTQVSDGSWQPRPSVQGMALQVSQHTFVFISILKCTLIESMSRGWLCSYITTPGKLCQQARKKLWDSKQTAMKLKRRRYLRTRLPASCC